MELKGLHPGNLLAYPETGIQELMRIFLMRTNFVPGTRHAIGWRGLKDSSKNVFAWSAKIRDTSGIYGLYFDRHESFDHWIRGQFILCYFPDPEEELVELCSIQAAACTQRKDYVTRVRDFLAYHELCSLFSIAIIDACVNSSEDALVIGLQSVSRQYSISQDGIIVHRDGHDINIVEPGGCDENFPAYSTALPFFRVFAASVTFNLDAPPVCLRYERHQGEEKVYTSNGECRIEASEDIYKEYLYLGYGNGSHENLITRIVGAEMPVVTEILWEQGDNIAPEYSDELWWRAHTLSDCKTLDKIVLGIDDRPQLIVVTGFLGSGKTTFIQNFIEYHVHHNRFVAVVQNEIGEVGLDGTLLDYDYAVVEIDEGCVCCTLIGSLKKGIYQILSRFHPDYIIVETTGLANPFNLLDELSEIEDVVRFDSVTTVIDGVNMEQSLVSYGIVQHQIAAADILLINKKDLVTGKEISAVKRKLREINKTAPMFSIVNGYINPALLYEIDSPDIPEMFRKRGRQTLSTHADYFHERDGLQSVTIPVSEPLDRDRFIQGITSSPHAVFRMKGILTFRDATGPELFQYVNGRFEFSELGNPKMKERFLILVGQEIQKESLCEAFNMILPDM